MILYTQPSCQPCKATKKWLDKAGIEYDQIDLSVDPAAADAVKALGYTSAPVVVVSDDWHWSGFRPTELSKL